MLDRTRGWSAPRRAFAVTAAFLASYAPAMQWGYRGVRLGGGELVLGGALAMAVAWVVLRVLGPAQGSAVGAATRAGVPVAALVAVLLLPAPALAHDPGQGELVAPGAMQASADPEGATVSVRIELDEVADLSPSGTIARRAGRTLEGPLEHAGPGTYVGDVEVDEPGRWFVYVELADAHDHAVEMWVPIVVPEDADGPVTARRDDWAYRPAGVGGFSPGQVVAGVVLYGLAAGVLVVTARTAAPRRAGQD